MFSKTLENRGVESLATSVSGEHYSTWPALQRAASMVQNCSFKNSSAALVGWDSHPWRVDKKVMFREVQWLSKVIKWMVGLLLQCSIKTGPRDGSQRRALPRERQLQTPSVTLRWNASCRQKVFVEISLLHGPWNTFLLSEYIHPSKWTF